MAALLPVSLHHGYAGPRKREEGCRVLWSWGCKHLLGAGKANLVVWEKQYVPLTTTPSPGSLKVFFS